MVGDLVNRNECCGLPFLRPAPETLTVRAIKGRQHSPLCTESGPTPFRNASCLSTKRCRSPFQDRNVLHPNIHYAIRNAVYGSHDLLDDGVIRAQGVHFDAPPS